MNLWNLHLTTMLYQQHITAKKMNVRTVVREFGVHLFKSNKGFSTETTSKTSPESVEVCK